MMYTNANVSDSLSKLVYENKDEIDSIEMMICFLALCSKTIKNIWNIEQNGRIFSIEFTAETTSTMKMCFVRQLSAILRCNVIYYPNKIYLV